MGRLQFSEVSLYHIRNTKFSKILVDTDDTVDSITFDFVGIPGGGKGLPKYGGVHEVQAQGTYIWPFVVRTTPY